MVMTKITEPYELQYINILKDIYANGHRQLNERTNVETIRIPHAVISVDLEAEFPILRCKQVYWKSSAQEILWIMQQQSNNINDLKPHIWDAWADEDGSIGKAYGYQVAKPIVCDGVTYKSQVHYVLERLSADSSDRRAVINLWDVDDLHEMNLVPCCFSSVWTVVDGKLNCMLTQRSADYLVGVPFNTTQYAILTHLFARHLGVGVGRLTHVMADVHIYCYDSHINGGKKMIDNFNKFDNLYMVDRSFLDDILKACDKDEDGNKESKELANDIRNAVSVIDSVPKLLINSSETNFFSISADDIQIEDYQFMDKIKFDVAT